MPRRRERGGPLRGEAIASRGAGEAGRLGLGWRLALYVGLLLAVWVPLGWLATLQLSPDSHAGLLAQAAAFLAAALLAGWTLLVRFEGRSPAALGFYLDGEAAGESVRGLALGIAVALLAVGLLALAGSVRWVPDEGSAGALVAGAGRSLLFLAVAAAAEEALFRGYPLQALARAWGPAWALVLTSVGFGLLHLANPSVTLVAMLNLIAAGALLGVVYLRTGSLWWATGAHLGWNWAHGFLADLPVSGLELFDTPFWDGVSRGPDWLGGGAFGPEGSVLTTAVVLAATALLWRRPWLRPGRAARAARPLTPLPDAAAADPSNPGEADA